MGLTQEQFARRVGVSLTTVARWESGKVSPSPMAQSALRRLRKNKEGNVG